MSNSTADLQDSPTSYPPDVCTNSPALSASSLSTPMVDSHRQNSDTNRKETPVEEISIKETPPPSTSSLQSKVEADPSAVTKIEDDNDNDDVVMIIPDEAIPPARKDKGKGKAVEVTEPATMDVSSHSLPTLPENLLSSYSCPICFSTVTNACLTPCGHVLCGLCLFSAVRSGIKRGLDLGIPLGREGTTPRCPVCRAHLKGWDGKGAGVIPLKIRTITAL